jgi:hypothetical protein
VDFRGAAPPVCVDLSMGATVSLGHGRHLHSIITDFWLIEFLLQLSNDDGNWQNRSVDR